MTTTNCFRNDLSPDAYHNLPGLSSSIANVLINQSPAHAYHMHPTMGGNRRPATKDMDKGTMIHTLLLGKGKTISAIAVDDWRTKVAKELRDEAWAKGQIPVRYCDYAEAIIATDIIRKNLRERDGIEFNGQSELAAFWNELAPKGVVACRGQLDHVWIRDNSADILDLKKCADASKGAIERSAERYGYAMQSAAYRRAVSIIRPDLAGRIRFRFAFVELEPPYAHNVVEPDGVFSEIGEQRWFNAVNKWAECLATNNWPAYADKFISAPAWALNKLINEMEDAA